MNTTALLAAVSQAVLPKSTDAAALRQRTAYFLHHMPAHVRIAFSLLLWSLWLFAGVRRQGAPSQLDAMVVWIGRLIERRIPLLHSAGLWLKTTACLLVLGDSTTRQQIYSARSVTSPDARYTDPTTVPAALPPTEVPMHGLEADYIIVGSGPAGATVARTLAQAGHSVMVFEEGPAVPAVWAASSAVENLSERFRAAGTNTTTGPERMPVLQGRGVGGSSVVNSAIAWRAPDDVLADWQRRDSGLAQTLSAERLARAYDAVEAGLGWQATPPSAFGANNVLMAQAAQALGLAAAPTRRYTRDCEGLGRCMEGCPRGHKLAMNVTLLPQAQAAGARLFADCQVRRVVFEGTRATGVVIVHAGQRYQVRARRAVIVAASAIQTPILLKRSGLSHPLLGQRFQAHPGASVAGIFDTPVRSHLGATQGYDSIHFRASDRFKLESITLADELMASRFPGVGPSFATAVDELPYTGLWCAQIRVRALGAVGGTLSIPSIRLHLTPEDERSLGKALKVLCEMFFAAGAREVLPGVVGLPERIGRDFALNSLLDGVAASRVAMIASHLFGTACLGSDLQSSVCDAFGKVHQAEGLYVADSSLFPTNLGVNPQHTIMALAQHVAWGLLERPEPRANHAGDP